MQFGGLGSPKSGRAGHGSLADSVLTCVFAGRVENYRHLRSILSESTGPGSTCMASPSPSREGGAWPRGVPDVGVRCVKDNLQETHGFRGERHGFL